MMYLEEIVVSIQCITYNHKSYLRQALDSFLMQKANFRFEVIVHDDASTDGTTDIVREYAARYPDIIHPLYEEENQWSKDALKHIFDRMNDVSKGKYIAYCEGDDYWQDPLKLQKQVDIMEKHPEVTMCYTGFQTIDTNSIQIYDEGYEKLNSSGCSGDLFFLLLNGNIILTPTVLLRKQIFNHVAYKSSDIYLDYMSFLLASSQGESIYIPERTACYRITLSGAMRSKKRWVDSVYLKIRRNFLLYYAVGVIKKPVSLLGIKAKLEIVNYSIRRKIEGDWSFLKYLLSNNIFLILYIFPALVQIKIENWNYRHRSR